MWFQCFCTWHLDFAIRLLDRILYYTKWNLNYRSRSSEIIATFAIHGLALNIELTVPHPGVLNNSTSTVGLHLSAPLLRLHVLFSQFLLKSIHQH